MTMKLSDAREILGLIHMALCTPQSYRSLIVCAPFISSSVFNAKILNNRKLKVPVLVITAPATERQIDAAIGDKRKDVQIISIPNLHAKVYIACGKDERDSLAIVGSFNFTEAALEDNIELGIRLDGHDPESRSLITKLERTIGDIVFRLTKGVPV